jgi:hypothetical protein
MKNLLFLLLLTSCVTPKKAVDVLSRPKNEPYLASICAEKYPVKDSIIKGDSIVRFDTLWETFTDTLISEPKVITETRIVPKTVTKWITRTDTIIRENTAKVAVLGSQIENLKGVNLKQSEMIGNLTTERNDFKKARDKWKLRFFLLLFGVGLAYALKVKMTKKLW